MLISEPHQTPRLKGQPRDVMPGSPTALLAIFTEVIRERFRPGNGLPWLWDGTATPRSDETGTAAGPRKILIEPAFSETSEIRNFRPAIYVDRGPTQPSKVSVGNLVTHEIRTGVRQFYAMAMVPINITVEASRKGESGTLADIVWYHLLGGIEPIRAEFGIHDITPPVLGTTTPVEKDKMGWVTPIALTITTNLNWATTPMGPVLREIRARVVSNPELQPQDLLYRGSTES